MQNFERMLRAIYAPQNIYCVHVDTKSTASVQAAVAGIVSCLPNVFMVSQPVRVIYAGWSRVQADLNCMADLYNSSIQWRYFINLCGQDFPLKTNLEIVRMLKSLWGYNSMESEKMPDRKLRRVRYVYHVDNEAVKVLLLNIQSFCLQCHLKKKKKERMYVTLVLMDYFSELKRKRILPRSTFPFYQEKPT